MPPAYNAPARVAERPGHAGPVPGPGDWARESRRPARARRLRHRAGRAARHVGARPSSRCEHDVMDPTRGSPASTSRCRCATSCRSPSRSHILRSGWPARIARRFTWRALGIGALSFRFLDPAEARPLGHRLLRDVPARVRPDRPRVTPIAMVTGFSCHATPRRPAAAATTASGSSSSAGPSLRVGKPTPGRPHLEPVPGRARSDRHGGPGGGSGCIGTPSQLPRVASHVPGRRRGPDDLHPAGRQEPARSTSLSPQLFAAEVMPEFREKEPSARRGSSKPGPAIEAAFSRASGPAPLAEDRIPTYQRTHHDRADGCRHREAAGGQPHRVLTFRKIGRSRRRVKAIRGGGGYDERSRTSAHRS